MRIKRLIVIFVYLIILGCNKKTMDNWDKENTRDVMVTNEVYLKAIEKAKENLPHFIELLKSKEENKCDFYIKVKYSEGENTEHLWFLVDNLKEKIFTATLDNVPQNLKSIKLNDKLEIEINEVEDWVVYKGDSVIRGNYIPKTIQ